MPGDERALPPLQKRRCPKAAVAGLSFARRVSLASPANARVVRSPPRCCSFSARRGARPDGEPLEWAILFGAGTYTASETSGNARCERVRFTGVSLQRIAPHTEQLRVKGDIQT